MSEKVLGVLQVVKPDWGGLIHEEIVVTSDRMLVIRKWKEHMGSGVGATNIFDALILGAIDAYETSESKRKMRKRGKQANTLEELLKADKNNVAIPNSIITEVRLKKRRGLPSLNVVINKKKYGWTLEGLNNQKKGVKIEDYETILRPVFGDKLFVKE